jgi:hypothetical protein
MAEDSITWKLPDFYDECPRLLVLDEFDGITIKNKSGEKMQEEIKEFMVEEAKEAKENNGADKKVHIRNFITAMLATEKELAEIRDSRKDLIKDYIDNKYLTKEEIKMAKQAISFAKKALDLEEIEPYLEETLKII